MKKKTKATNKGGQMPTGGSRSGFRFKNLSFYVSGAIALDFVVGGTV